jgi:hypothetical protein
MVQEAVDVISSAKRFLEIDNHLTHDMMYFISMNAIMIIFVMYYKHTALG